MKIGDKVKITDGSYVVRVDRYDPYITIGSSKDTFEIIKELHNDWVTDGSQPIHDIFIKNTKDGAIFLHSKCCVRLAEPETKEVTMKDLEEKYGCKVKVVK